ncbi:MAG: hypothetical protein ABIV21_02775 [Pyrinomonadaceae bacterium]
MNKLIKNFELGLAVETQSDISVTELFDGPMRQILSIRLKNKAILSKHSAREPITVFCISGSGTFLAGPDLSESQKIGAGILLTLESGIEHEVAAEPEVHILVTKFKAS